ncbi:MAG TPA: hypothetical protein PK245_06720, partial [Clostridia bacterium]|nr:hypothetical protein [Clostridia bacterium]
RAFQSRRVDAVYLPFRVGTAQLRDFMGLALRLPVAGFSVTIPHKQRIMRYLDAIDPLARRIGAVNTVWRKGGKWRGANTDAPAVVAPLSRHLNLAKATVLLIGSGGAARGSGSPLAAARASSGEEADGQHGGEEEREGSTHGAVQHRTRKAWSQVVPRGRCVTSDRGARPIELPDVRERRRRRRDSY